ncbi:hypothetical protein [Corallococcus exiguus]|uniref:hypothetical protein n=1 Tax=Corallococcus exiguus TaxID=83462 RepID=UPI0011C35F01|nr:hypothetical protein [Corallococcus exiguus]NPC71502.1 hypothetical protein [Corallococcus exiguus]NPD25636.1 hypothetical protein [Corallococcus exiguus]
MSSRLPTRTVAEHPAQSSVFVTSWTDGSVQASASGLQKVNGQKGQNTQAAVERQNFRHVLH